MQHMTNKPTHIVYHVKEIGTADETQPQRGVWTKVGAAWSHRDAKGFSMVLDVIPFNGRLVAREAVQEGEQAEVQPGV